jgi:hypothetical protein
MIWVTRKCFSLFRGSTAVHFVWSNFLALNAFDVARVITFRPAQPPRPARL